MIERLFLHHPRSVGESYAEHALVAASFGATLIVAGLACLVHAVLPAACARTGSDTVKRLNTRLGARRRRGDASAAAAAEWHLFYDI